MMPGLHRRRFLQLSTSTAAATLLLRSRAEPLPNSRSSATPFRQLAYGQVELLDSPLREQFEHNHKLFLSLDEDSLLKPFRQLAGMSAPGEDMGGWYSPSSAFDPPKNMTGYIPGHSFGQYLSSLARACAITGDVGTQQKVRRLVHGFAATVSPKFYQGYCLPCYTFDKIACGLIDASLYAAEPSALATLRAATDAALPFLPDRALTRQEMAARPHPNVAFTWDEPYTLPENLYRAYLAGAGSRYHALARKYLQNSAYFIPLASGENVLPGKHAYSHVNALSSAMQAHLVDGGEMHLRAAQNGFRFAREQSYATGGWGPNETFQRPDTDDLAKSLEDTHATFETPCGAYGHFKITRYLLCATGDSAYGDSMETVLYNTILGARLIQPDGTSFYYSDFGGDAQKVWYGEKWPCCSGTFPQLTADYGISSYLLTPNGLAVNLYTPSRVRWQRGSAHVTLTQHTLYPYQPEITFVLTCDRPVSFSLLLRIPAWAGPATRVTVNGRGWPGASPRPGSWHAVEREWRNGDRVELTYDMSLRLQPLDGGHPELVALMQGPLALFTPLPAPETFSPAQLLKASRDGSKWNIPIHQGIVPAVPYTGIDQQRYRLYQKLSAA